MQNIFLNKKYLDDIHKKCTVFLYLFFSKVERGSLKDHWTAEKNVTGAESNVKHNTLRNDPANYWKHKGVNYTDNFK